MFLVAGSEPLKLGITILVSGVINCSFFHQKPKCVEFYFICIFSLQPVQLNFDDIYGKAT